jgi:hypothetical protein
VLEAQLEDMLLKAVGDLEYYDTETVEGIDHSAEIEDIERRIADVVMMMAGRSDGVKQMLTGRVAELGAALEELQQQPVTESETVYVPTGETYGEIWGRADQQERRELLVDSGIKVWAGDPSEAVLEESILGSLEGPAWGVWRQTSPQVVMLIPKDIAERATNKKQLVALDTVKWQEKS